MLSFRQITLDDIPTLNAYFNAYPHTQCDRAMGSTVMWRDYFKNRFAVHNGTIILSAKLNDEMTQLEVDQAEENQKMKDLCDNLNKEMEQHEQNVAELVEIIEQMKQKISDRLTNGAEDDIEEPVE
jgi:hypothetical protein